LPKSSPAFFTPFSRALNQGMPAILTTVTIFFWSWAKDGSGIAATPKTAATPAAPRSFNVLRLFMDTWSWLGRGRPPHRGEHI
jgi:hypothetical protein